MKKMYSLVFMFFLFTVSAFGEVDVDRIVNQIKKDFEVVEAKRDIKIENNIGSGTYTTSNVIQNGNIKRISFGHYANNIENFEEYFLKDGKIQLISTEKIEYSFDNKNKNTVKIEKEEYKYYFDENQKLIRHIASDKKVYDGDQIPKEVKEKAESLKKNVKMHLKENNSKNTISEMRKEFDSTQKEVMKTMDDMRKEIDVFLKEMEDIFEKF